MDHEDPEYDNMQDALDNDVFEGSHAEFGMWESYVSKSDRLWEKWTSDVEQILIGEIPDFTTLDGDQEKDGYSLDDAYEAWRLGQTPGEYVQAVLMNKGGPLVS